jgi:hypothetical protein
MLRIKVLSPKSLETKNRPIYPQLDPNARVCIHMREGFSPDDGRAEAGDPVWRLLARSPRPEPDAWFTVRTLARCRHAGIRAESRSPMLGRFWRWALGTGLGVGLAALLMTTQAPTDTPQSANQKNVQEAFEIMASMGSDSDSSPPASPSSSTAWQDSSL